MKHLFLYLSLIVPVNMFSAIVYQFEDGDLSYISSKKSTFEISDTRSIDGENSLKWDFEPSGELTITGFEIPPVNWNNFFSINIYNEVPMDKEQIVFSLSGARSFYMKLNFKGWRTIWINHANDMKGSSGAVDSLTIKAPKNAGTLYIDQIVPEFRPGNRLSYTGDIHVPYANIPINKTPSEFNWNAKLRYYDRLDFSVPSKPYSQEVIDSIDLITKRYEDLILLPTITAVNNQTLTEFKTQLDYFKTRRISMKKPYTSLSLVTDPEILKYEKTAYFQDVGIFLRQVSFAYRITTDQAAKDTLLSYYLEMMDYLYDQGWDIGSGTGSNSHMGYSLREFAESVFFMRDALKAAGEMDHIQKMLAWYINLGGVIDVDPAEIIGVNMDLLNTLSSGMLATILSIDNPHTKASMLYKYKEYFNESFETSVGLTGGFKPDGSSYHHRMHYPGYGNPALVGFGTVLFSLNGTSFAISQHAHELMKKQLLMSRIAANKNHIMLLTSGRHPNGSTILRDGSFKYFALAGTPDQSQSFDMEVANAYLRLFPNDDPTTVAHFKSLGASAEADPNGSWTMNRASLQLHRQKDWLVGARGFSRYLVGTEIYLKDNRYGRYFGYGQFQYMKTDMTNSGFVMEGFNWNHFPGTTAIHLPLEELNAHAKGTEMLVQAESFSGGNSLDDTGLFAMKLKENKKYDGSHVVRKSIFFLDNRLVFLGSGVNNTNQRETHTTVFQNYLGNKKNKAPVTNNNLIILDDSVNNTYYVPIADNTNLVYKAGMQNSLHEKTMTPTANNFETAYINHSISPKDQSYRYYMLVQGTDQEKASFVQDPQFEVRQQDNLAHIVYDNKNKTAHYVLFETENIKDPYVYGTSHPSTIIVKEIDNGLKVSFVNPDLAFYGGLPEEDVKIYSAQWGNHEAPFVRNYLDLKGAWYSDDSHVKVSRRGDKTTVEITTQGGEPVQFNLRSTK